MSHPHITLSALCLGVVFATPMHAAVQTQSQMFLNGPGAPFARFDPNQGALNAVDLTIDALVESAGGHACTDTETVTFAGSLRIDLSGRSYLSEPSISQTCMGPGDAFQIIAQDILQVSDTFLPADGLSDFLGIGSVPMAISAGYLPTQGSLFAFGEITLSYRFTPAVIPLPASSILLATAVAGLGLRRRKP